MPGVLGCIVQSVAAARQGQGLSLSFRLYVGDAQKWLQVVRVELSTKGSIFVGEERCTVVTANT